MGVDYIAKTASSTTVVYPLFDAHGNMIATVNTSGTLADGRYFDAWGNIIGSGSATGEPKGRYCANLGHVQDDESSLIYMRARYYEPGTGRFVSEDRSENGKNWYCYAANAPTNEADYSGNEPVTIFALIALFVTAAGVLNELWLPADPMHKALKNFVTATLLAVSLCIAATQCLNADDIPLGRAVVGLTCWLGTAAILTLAIRQLALMLELATIDDPSITDGAAGLTDSFMDFNSQVGRSL